MSISLHSMVAKYLEKAVKPLRNGTERRATGDGAKGDEFATAGYGHSKSARQTGSAFRLNTIK